MADDIYTSASIIVGGMNEARTTRFETFLEILALYSFVMTRAE